MAPAELRQDPDKLRDRVSRRPRFAQVANEELLVRLVVESPPARVRPALADLRVEAPREEVAGAPSAADLLDCPHFHHPGQARALRVGDGSVAAERVEEGSRAS